MKYDTTLLLGDCLERMKEIPDGSVDMVLTDPPYGTTACKWDSIIPLEPMWEQLKRIIKPNGAIVMTASQPFTSALVMSNPEWFKYCWVWLKNTQTGISLARTQPMRCVEDIAVFGMGRTKYNKQPTQSRSKVPSKNNKRTRQGKSDHYGFAFADSTGHKDNVNPRNLLKFDVVPNGNGKKLHPTQKPVALMEYLIKTYTNESETVLDFTMGSGTTGVAAKNINRNFIGIELDEEYFKIAQERIAQAQLDKMLVV